MNNAQKLYNAIMTIKGECQEHNRCDGACPFYVTNLNACYFVGSRIYPNGWIVPNAIKNNMHCKELEEIKEVVNTSSMQEVPPVIEEVTENAQT